MTKTATKKQEKGNAIFSSLVYIYQSLVIDWHVISSLWKMNIFELLELSHLKISAFCLRLGKLNLEFLSSSQLFLVMDLSLRWNWKKITKISNRVTNIIATIVLSCKDFVEVEQIVIWKMYTKNQPDVDQFQITTKQL